MPLPPHMDQTIEAKVTRDVEQQLARLVLRSPRLAELPITPLFDVDDLVRLDIALERFAEMHRSRSSRKLVDAVRTILGMARTRLRVAGAVRHAVMVAEARQRE